MLKFMSHGKITATLGVIGAAMLGTATHAAAQSCDRACLTGMITTYVDALVAHDPSALPLAHVVKFTEDGLYQPLGEGMWESVTGKTDFRHDYIDVTGQVAAAHVELREGDVPVLYSLALHIEDGKIAGIETLIQRITPESPFQPTELGAPIRRLDDAIPADQKMTREELIDIALSYSDGLRIGNFSDAAVPFGPDTYRVENGMITAGEGCVLPECGMYDQRIMVHPGLIPSVIAVDEEQGVALLWMNFGFTNSYGEGNALVTFEAFKIWGGKIRTISAFFATLPINSSRFWNSSDPVRGR